MRTCGTPQLRSSAVSHVNVVLIKLCLPQRARSSLCVAPAVRLWVVAGRHTYNVQEIDIENLPDGSYILSNQSDLSYRRLLLTLDLFAAAGRDIPLGLGQAGYTSPHSSSLKVRAEVLTSCGTACQLELLCWYSFLLRCSRRWLLHHLRNCEGGLPASTLL